MADYQRMYMILFNAISDAIDVLQKAQKNTEEIFISSKEPEIALLSESNDENCDKLGNHHDVHLKKIERNASANFPYKRNK